VYARTKAVGEECVKREFPNATILRPSVVFGPEDEFFNRFAALARMNLGVPLIGGGDGPRMQPVYVGDVASAVAAALARGDARGKTYELGGPEVVTLREILELVIRETGHGRFVLPLPWAMGSLAAAASAVLPRSSALSVTFDQLKQLRIDNVAAPGAKGLAELGVTPTSMAAVVPEMLARYRS
jgi:NADH dehydrogenase